VPQRFEELPDREQRAVIAAGQHMTQLAYEYVTVILVGASPEDSSHVNHGSAFVIRLGTRMFLGTAAHVLAKYEERLSLGAQPTIGSYVVLSGYPAESSPSLRQGR
jgi:hypothetical protein